VSCGGQAESAPTPGGSFPAPNAARETPVSRAQASTPPIAETCADNPLLNGCFDVPPPGLAPSAAPPSVPELPPSPAPSLDDPSLAPVERVELVLSMRCGSCHGQPNPLCDGCDGLSYIDDIGRMINQGQIVPCNWKASNLSRRVAQGEMPPPAAGVTPPTATELDIVAGFVDGLCDNLTNGGAADTERMAIESWLSRDCGSCHSNAAADMGATAAGLDSLDDIEQLLEAGLIVPCNAQSSVLLQRLLDDSMPPPGSSAPRPTSAEIRALRSFIQRPCSRR
jgi:hypothetical protein